MSKKHIVMIIFAALIIFALTRLDGESLLHSMAQIPAWLVFALLGLQILTQFMVNLQWFVISRITEMRISFWRMFYINSQGAVVDAVTPGVKFGGEITRGVHISRAAGCTAERAASLVALQKLFSLTALFAVLMVLSSSLPFSVNLVILALVILIVALILLSKRFEWLNNFLKETKSGLIFLKNRPLVLAGLFALSLAIWLLYPAKFYILTANFAPELGFAALAAITFTAYIVAMLPIFPGGLGGFEASMSAMLIYAGISAADSAVATIFFRFVTFWFVMLASLVFILFLRRKYA